MEVTDSRPFDGPLETRDALEGAMKGPEVVTGLYSTVATLGPKSRLGEVRGEYPT